MHKYFKNSILHNNKYFNEYIKIYNFNKYYNLKNSKLYKHNIANKIINSRYLYNSIFKSYIKSYNKAEINKSQILNFDDFNKEYYNILKLYNTFDKKFYNSFNKEHKLSLYNHNFIDNFQNFLEYKKIIKSNYKFKDISKYLFNNVKEKSDNTNKIEKYTTNTIHKDNLITTKNLDYDFIFEKIKEMIFEELIFMCGDIWG